MQISSTQLTRQQFPKAVSAEAAQSSQEPTDSFTFFAGNMSGKEMFQTATVAVAGGLVGAVPGVGAASGVFAAVINEHDDELGSIIGLASTVTNVVASAAVFGGGFSPYLLAVPAAMGGIAWGGYAYNQASAG